MGLWVGASTPRWFHRVGVTNVWASDEETASTIVSASTASTVQARNTASASPISDPVIGRVLSRFDLVSLELQTSSALAQRRSLGDQRRRGGWEPARSAREMHDIVSHNLTELLHHTRRRHRALGMLTPSEIKAAWAAARNHNVAQASFAGTARAVAVNDGDAAGLSETADAETTLDHEHLLTAAKQFPATRHRCNRRSSQTP